MENLHRIFQDLNEVKAKEALLRVGGIVSQDGILTHNEFETILNQMDPEKKGD